MKRRLRNLPVLVSASVLVAVTVVSLVWAAVELLQLACDAEMPDDVYCGVILFVSVVIPLVFRRTFNNSVTAVYRWIRGV